MSLTLANYYPEKKLKISHWRHTSIKTKSHYIHTESDIKIDWSMPILKRKMPPILDKWQQQKMKIHIQGTQKFISKHKTWVLVYTF